MVTSFYLEVRMEAVEIGRIFGEYYFKVAVFVIGLIIGKRLLDKIKEWRKKVDVKNSTPA